MISFSKRLGQAVQKMNNPTVLGLDPRLDYIPPTVLQAWQNEISDQAQFVETALWRFNRTLIDVLCDIVPAVKPQAAYYEMYGLPGLKALARTIAYAKERGMLVILDGKRNDIGSTAEAYAAGWLGKTQVGTEAVAFWDADALTVNAYLGSDGIEPFLRTAVERGKGLFALVRTSNPSAADFQDLMLADGRKLYEAFAEKISIWGEPYVGDDGYAPLGAVMGATWPEQAEQMRQVLKHSWILVPGYGAQGATAADCARQFKADGSGALVNASRSLMCAYKKIAVLPEQDFALATRQEALRMRDELNAALAERKQRDAD